ncbi:MAG: hypothetical protein IJV35_07010 [Neisseriaceae bacterium]|nr:hypothetical protein [Neisseriaceae bacterium]
MNKSLVFSVGVVLLLSACGNKLPKCNSEEAENTIAEIINGKRYYFGDFVTMKDIKQDAFNKKRQIRTCTATLKTTKDEGDIKFSIKWEDQEKGEYWIEIHEQN